jgi:curli biogenesis system outer membrane secretion channel CsgG
MFRNISGDATMKKAVAAILFLLMTGAVMSALGQDAPQTGGRKKRVAVIDFEYGTVHSDVAAIFGSDVDVGKGICDLLVKYLVKDGSYSVIERRALDKILAEQNFSTSDRANPATAARIGHILGLDAIIVGSITQFGNENKNVKVGGAGGGFGGFGVGGFGHKKSKAIVKIDARLIDVDTAEILGVADGAGESSRESTSLLGGGGNWHGFGAGAVDFGSSDFQNTIIGEAVNKAVQALATNVVADKDKLVARTINVEATIADVDPSGITLNVGSNKGLKVGDQLTVERVGREIKDPTTGKVIRRVTTPVGVIQVSSVDEGSSVAKPVSGSGFKVGDLAKTKTQ